MQRVREPTQRRSIKVFTLWPHTLKSHTDSRLREMTNTLASSGNQWWRTVVSTLIIHPFNRRSRWSELCKRNTLMICSRMSWDQDSSQEKIWCSGRAPSKTSSWTTCQRQHRSKWIANSTKDCWTNSVQITRASRASWGTCVAFSTTQTDHSHLCYLNTS